MTNSLFLLLYFSAICLIFRVFSPGFTVGKHISRRLVGVRVGVANASEHDVATRRTVRLGPGKNHSLRRARRRLWKGKPIFTFENLSKSLKNDLIFKCRLTSNQKAATIELLFCFKDLVCRQRSPVRSTSARTSPCTPLPTAASTSRFRTSASRRRGCWKIFWRRRTVSLPNTPSKKISHHRWKFWFRSPASCRAHVKISAVSSTWPFSPSGTFFLESPIARGSLLFLSFSWILNFKIPWFNFSNSLNAYSHLEKFSKVELSRLLCH